jgi:hypothetical protein
VFESLPPFSSFPDAKTPTVRRGLLDTHRLAMGILIAANHSEFGCLATLGVWVSGNAEFGCLATRLATRSLGVWQRGVWVSGNAPRWRVRGGIGQYPAAIIEPHGFGRLVVVPVGNAMLADQKPEKAWC